jgi:hypothetical protein
MDLNKIIDNRLDRMANHRKQLVESWSPYIRAIEKYKKEKGEEALRETQKFNIAQCIENAVWEGGIKGKNSRLFETTYSDNVTFLGVQLPVISAILPSLVLDELALVQALDRRIGEVFYMDVRYGTTKGKLSAAGVIMDPKTGHATGEAALNYATANVYEENTGALTAVASKDYTVAYKPVITGDAATALASRRSVGVTVVKIYDVAHTVLATLTVASSADGTDTLTTSTTYGGQIVLATGVVTLTDSATFAADDYAKVSYTYNYEKEAGGGVPELDIKLSSDSLTAEDFMLRTKYTMGTAIDLEKAHGINFEEEMVKYLGGEIKFEMDHRGIVLISDAAAGGSAATGMGTFNCTYNASNQTEAGWVFKKFQILDFIKKGSNNIFKKTLRGKATFVICGLDAERVITQLTPHFVPAAGANKVATGPHKVGTLEGMPVIVDPFIADDLIVLGYRGDNFLEAGLVFAPYIPLFSTPTILTSDMKAQKGFMSSAGYKIINPGFYTKGTITGLSY